MWNVVQFQDLVSASSDPCTSIIRWTQPSHPLQEAFGRDLRLPGGSEATEDDEPIIGEDGVDIDPLDSRAIETELDGLILRLADDMSELATIKLLPRAKDLYERLHPETKHGGHRGQVAKPAPWPSFASYVAGRTGLSKRSVYNRLERAELLATLDPDAEAACYGCGIANQVGLLVRVARIPKEELQRDLVNIYRNAGPKMTKQQLQKWEDEFRLTSQTPKRRSEPDPASLEEEQEDAVDGDTSDVVPVADPCEPALAKIMAVLGVSAIEECVPAIQELFKVLQVTNATDALSTARSLLEGRHAAE